VLRAGNFNLVAGVDAETPGMFSVTVERSGQGKPNPANEDCESNPLQTMSSLLRNGAAASGDTLLSAKKRGFLFGFEVEEARIVERLAVRSLRGKRVQLFLDDSGSRFPGHSFDQLSTENR